MLIGTAMFAGLTNKNSKLFFETKNFLQKIQD